MSIAEPRDLRHPNKPSPIEGRWRWWYSAISDWMIENPGGKFNDCAIHLGRAANTISMIVNTDMFREFHAQRLQKWRETHDYAIANKLTVVAETGLGLILDVMKEKGKQIPLKTLVELTSSSLEKLGYGTPASPSVVINAPTNNAVIYAPISPTQLEEARDALRSAERNRALQGPTLELIPSQTPMGVERLLEEEGPCAPPLDDA